jgi:hypothetical protein
MIDPEFGYYTCAGLTFEKKIEALLYSKTNNKPVEWHFQDHIFSKYPWHIEPEESLDKLYDKRARELREKYDYLILSYSGGSDSHNILESFIRQGLHLDEIVTTYVEYANKTHSVLNPQIKDNWNIGAEHQLNTMPKLKYAQEKLPKTKITLHDETKDLYESFKKYEDEEWALKRADHLGSTNAIKHNMFNNIQLRKEFDKDKSIAIIWGRDKPKTFISKGNFYTRFSDTVLNQTHMLRHNKHYTNLKVESFYWNSSCLSMLAKQAHVIKRWVENTPSIQKHWVNGITRESIHLHEKLIRNVIYTTWDENWFQVDKPTNQWFTQFDSWFRRDPNLIRQYMFWKKGIEHVTKLLPEYVNYLDGVPSEFRIFNKSYLIGPTNLKPIL